MMRQRKAAPLINEIRRLYEDERLAIREIGERLRVNHRLVLIEMQKHRIKRRAKHTRRELSFVDEVCRLYCDEKLSARVIGDRLGLSQRVVLTRLRRGGALVRNRGGARAGKPAQQPQPLTAPLELSPTPFAAAPALPEPMPRPCIPARVIGGRVWRGAAA